MAYKDSYEASEITPDDAVKLLADFFSANNCGGLPPLPMLLEPLIIQAAELSERTDDQRLKVVLQWYAQVTMFVARVEMARCQKMFELHNAAKADKLISKPSGKTFGGPIGKQERKDKNKSSRGGLSLFDRENLHFN